MDSPSSYILHSDVDFQVALAKIWKNHPVEKLGVTLNSYYPKEVLKNEITFLSLNPSFTKGAKDDDPPYVIDKTDRFYRKFDELGFSPWTFLDLLYIRDSMQNNIKGIYTNKNGGKEFIVAQINITLGLLKKIKPKLVIVANGFAEQLLLNCPEFKDEATKPTGSNNNIFCYCDIPFIMRESKFMGSRIHWSQSEKNGSKEKLVGEIKRVLAFSRKE